MPAYGSVCHGDKIKGLLGIKRSGRRSTGILGALRALPFALTAYGHVEFSPKGV